MLNWLKPKDVHFFALPTPETRYGMAQCLKVQVESKQEVGTQSRCGRDIIKLVRALRHTRLFVFDIFQLSLL